jgi:hypothetical protein
MPVCTEVVPPEVTFADGVRVACHLYPTADAPMAGEAAMDHATRSINVIGADVEGGIATVVDAGADAAAAPAATDVEGGTAAGSDDPGSAP